MEPFNKTTVIKGKKFTKREIDIIACLARGRAGAIPTLLSISARTVQTHVHNIMLKIECNAREGIIDFIERSDKFSLIMAHYQSLVIDYVFEKSLKEINTLIKKEKKMCTLWYEPNAPMEHMNVIHRLIKHMNSVGIDAVLKSKKGEITGSLYLGVNKACAETTSFSLAVVSKEKYYLQSEVNNVIPIGKEKEEDQIYIRLDHIAQNALGQTSEIVYSDVCAFETYYDCIFKVLQKMYPSYVFDKIISEFNSQYQTLCQEGVFSSFEVGLDQTTEAEVAVPSKLHIKTMKALSSHTTSACLFVLGLLSIGLLVIYQGNNMGIASSNQYVRSDLRIPVDSAFLDRSELINQIGYHFSQKKAKSPAITVVGLVGIGGVGKTILARTYGKTQTNTIVWEINAETHTSLIDSFFNFAYAFAKTKEQKEEVNLIKDMQNTLEKEKQLIIFVKRQLKNQPNWLLIYDNAESLVELNSFFPYDANVWGEGRVIITTRNSNILTSSHIESAKVIQIDQLNQKDALTLFCKILYKKEPQSLMSEEQEKASSFLIKIPPFPLDVSMAAYYIKNAALSFDQYIERITQYGQIFDRGQQALLEEISDYMQTRYGLITLSITKLIETNPEYKELLFFMCFCDSQHIPFNFLAFCKNPVLIDHFIRDLKKYSLITNQSNDEKNSEGVFSLHRSTQLVTQGFLMSMMSENKKKELIDTYSQMIKKYYNKYFYNEYKNIYLLIPHLEVFLQKINILKLKEDDKEKYVQNLLYVLGHAYYHGSRNFVKEKECFEEVYRIQEKKKGLTHLECASMLKLLTYVCLELELRKDGIAYAERGLKLCDKIPESDILASSILKVIGFGYLQENDFEKSKYYFEEALHRIVHIDSEAKKDSEASIYSYMGLLYSFTYVNGDNAHKGLEYAHKALEIIDGTQLYYKTKVKPLKKLSCRIVEHKVNLGEIYCLLGQYEKAQNFYFKDVEFITNNSLDNCVHTISKIIAKVGMGECYLRANQLKTARESLTKSFQETEKLIGKNNGFILKLAVWRAEVHIRLGELDKAYDDCQLAFKEEKKIKTNYAKTLLLMAYYHAAVIKYKQGDLTESWKYFKDFFDKTKAVYKVILSEQKYQKLDKEKSFEIPIYQIDFSLKSIEQCFKKSTTIFSAMYGDTHPFVCNYVLINKIDINETFRSTYAM